jgi:hypothetical protein
MRSRQKPRFLPAVDEVMSDEIARLAGGTRAKTTLFARRLFGVMS